MITDQGPRGPRDDGDPGTHAHDDHDPARYRSAARSPAAAPTATTAARPPAVPTGGSTATPTSGSGAGVTSAMGAGVVSGAGAIAASRGGVAGGTRCRRVPPPAARVRSAVPPAPPHAVPSDAAARRSRARLDGGSLRRTDVARPVAWRWRADRPRRPARTAAVAAPVPVVAAPWRGQGGRRQEGREGRHPGAPRLRGRGELAGRRGRQRLRHRLRAATMAPSPDDRTSSSTRGGARARLPGADHADEVSGNTTSSTCGSARTCSAASSAPGSSTPTGRPTRWSARRSTGCARTSRRSAAISEGRGGIEGADHLSPVRWPDWPRSRRERGRTGQPGRAAGTSAGPASGSEDEVHR